MDSGEGYLVEFDNPAVFFMKKDDGQSLPRRLESLMKTGNEVDPSQLG